MVLRAYSQAIAHGAWKLKVTHYAVKAILTNNIGEIATQHGQELWKKVVELTSTIDGDIFPAIEN